MQGDTFRQTTDFEARKSEGQKMLDKHAHSVPLILQSKSIDVLKSKYLVPQDMDIPQFMIFIRKKLKSLKPSEALFLFVETIGDKDDSTGSTLLAPQDKTVGEVYAMCKHSDNFLYMHIEKENTFGA